MDLRRMLLINAFLPVICGDDFLVTYSTCFGFLIINLNKKLVYANTRILCGALCSQENNFSGFQIMEQTQIIQRSQNTSL